MASQQTKAGEITENAVRSDRYSPTNTIAKRIFKDNPKVFKNLQNARGNVRSYRGERPSNLHPSKIFPQLSPKSLVVSEVHRKPTEQPTVAKILLLDIETAPLKGFMWGIWNQNISPFEQLIDDWFILCWSAKWLFSEKIISGKLTRDELVKEDDKRIMKDMWRLMEQADIIITHNGDHFDLPKINTRFLMHGLTPTMPYQSIDTYKHVRKRFSFTSNKLDYICMKLGLRRKIDTGGFELWRECAYGNIKALGKMSKYCDNDVLCLEDLYLHIRPWIIPHPNMGLYITEDVCSCPNCGSLSYTETGGKYRTQVSEYLAFRCNDCGAIGRVRKAFNKGLNKNLTVSIAR